MTKILIVKGSPRKSGNSAVLADQVAAGAQEAGAQVESFYLHGMDISPCDACEACQASADAECIVDDDMQLLYPKVREADAIVYASPIYWYTISAQLKLFMDRCYALGGDEVEDHGLITATVDRTTAQHCKPAVATHRRFGKHPFEQ